ncbi:unnamed protein product [Acanthoscelides obtectus]|uniref:Uncharacterized protein n=1 Tax=Acanthoscelides obtectus TaxID=200917 RepID=A0A9P0NY23_ACAOB|nr:unnamed protein product [Acanthoscelides obtectus]CAK1646184.1 hypothetical protein AOBTE_LOCUS14502 [Acanthoscelides obtectus]
MATKTRKNEKCDSAWEFDEKRLRDIIKESFLKYEYLGPVEQKIESKIKDLSESIQYMSDSFDDQKRALESVLLENKTLKKETADLKKRLQMLEGRVEAFENKERTKNMIVAGVPKQTNLDIK